MEPERLRRKGFVKQMSFKSGVTSEKAEGVIVGDSKALRTMRRWWLWWGDACKIISHQFIYSTKQYKYSDREIITVSRVRSGQ